MNNIFSNPDDDDEIQSSRFAMNLKKETYDQLMITFNNVTSGSGSGSGSGSSAKGSPPSSNLPEILTQSTITSTASSRYSSSSSSSCDYVVNVPTSFVVAKEQIEAFYKNINKFKRTNTTLKLNDATASVFMDRGMFEQFVKFIKKNAHTQELVRIEQSYRDAINEFKPLVKIVEEPHVLKLTNLSVNPIVKSRASLSTFFSVLYTTPVNGIGLPFLPLTYELVSHLEWAKLAIDSCSPASLALIPANSINKPVAQQAYTNTNAARTSINQALGDIQTAVNLIRTNPGAVGAAAAINQATTQIQAAQAAAMAAMPTLAGLAGAGFASFSEAVQVVANLPATITFYEEMSAISQKALTFFCSYFQTLYMKTNIPGGGGLQFASSIGRMPTYLPALNSTLNQDSYAPQVRNMNIFPLFAKPSYNVEIITDFLRGIITGTGLPNREPLSRPEMKLKDIQNKTHLYVFKSTPDYSMNYDALLKRLYYKYPAYLTPNHRVSAEARNAILTAATAAAGGTFNQVIGAVIGVCDKTHAHSIIFAVAIATRAFILNRASTPANAAATLNVLFNTIDFGGANGVNVKAAISAYLNNPAIAGIVQDQLNPLIGAACARGGAVHAAAKREVTKVVMSNPAASVNEATLAITAAIDSEINNQPNFAAFMYDNDTLLGLMEYSDQAQSIDAASVYPAINPNVQFNLLSHANDLKTLYKQPNLQQQQSQTPANKFDAIDDDILYAICGPVYFDYNWIFKQQPELIRYILGEERNIYSRETKNEWIPSRPDPLTGNVYYINRSPTNPEYPKLRFDNPKKYALPPPTQQAFTDAATAVRGTETISWKEWYVSPREAMAGINLTKMRETSTTADAMANPIGGNFQGLTNRAGVDLRRATQKEIDACYNWAFPGYYRYELTQIVKMDPQPNAFTNRYYQLMRPSTSDGQQDYTQPNLPSAYPPPLQFIVPSMRGTDDTCMIHVWLPDLSSTNSPSFAKFMSIGTDGTLTLNRNVFQDHMYKMVQLIFKTAKKNAGENAGTSSSSSGYGAGAGSGYGYGAGAGSGYNSKKRICIKIMAIGYDVADRNLKEVTTADDRTFVGDAFFFAIRDYSMLFASDNLSVTVYYDTAKQQNIRQLYNDHLDRCKSQLLRINKSTELFKMNLQIRPSDEFFTLTYPGQLIENDLLYFVDYCSNPRAMIGNCGEWPENIEEMLDQAIGTPPQSQPLIQCLHNAFSQIDQLYTERGIQEKMTYIANNLNDWNIRPLTGVAPAPRTQPAMVRPRIIIQNHLFGNWGIFLK